MGRARTANDLATAGGWPTHLPRTDCTAVAVLPWTTPFEIGRTLQQSYRRR